MRWLVLLAACGTPAPVAPLANVAAPVVAAPAPADAPDATPCRPLGVLSICGEKYEAPSHGGEELARIARYTVENFTDNPVDVEVETLDVVDPQGKRIPLTLDLVEWANNTTGTRATVDPVERLSLRIHGGGSIAALHYHVVYHHAVRFRSGGAEVTVDAGELYFRYPHQLP
jgi:hypothetical protein